MIEKRPVVPSLKSLSIKMCFLLQSKFRPYLSDKTESVITRSEHIFLTY